MFVVEDIYDIYEMLDDKKETLYYKLEKENDMETVNEYESLIESIFGDTVEIDRSQYRIARNKRHGSFLELIVFLGRDIEREYHYILFIELKVDNLEDYDDFDELQKMLDEKRDDGTLGDLKVRLQDGYCDEMLLEDLED